MPTRPHLSPRQHLPLIAPPQLIQRPRALLEPLVARYPEVRAVPHDVCEHGAAEEDHVLPAGRVLDADLEFLEKMGKNGLGKR